MSQSNKFTNWLITHNNPECSLQEYLEMWMKKCKYVNGQVEAGENNTTHIQAYISLKKQDRLTALKRMDPRAHFEPVKFDNGASSYCLKEETRLEGPIELGEKPLQRSSKKDWKEIKEKAQQGKMEEIPDDVYVRHYNTLKRIEKDHVVVPHRTTPKNIEWHYGKTGTGKSRIVWEKYPDAYLKEDNKWWCGYRGHKDVIFDDLGLEPGKVLVNKLKRWTDPWRNHGAETKGGYIAQEFDNFIITSNYHPRDMFVGEDLAAMERRMKLHHYGGL